MPRVMGLKGAVTLADFPCVDGAVPWPDPLKLFVAWTDGSRWQVRNINTVDPGTVYRVTEDDLPGDCPPDASPFWFLYPDDLDDALDALPIDNFMNTSPAWRSNIQLIGPGASTSYQGEYPSGMLRIDPGSLLSLSSFAQDGDGVCTKIVFANMHCLPAQRSASIRFVSSRSRRVLRDIEVRTNAVSVVDITDVKPDPGDFVVAVSRDISGVPLYLTHTDDFTELSFEHTHPPVELVVFGDRAAYQRAIKGYWIEEAFT